MTAQEILAPVAALAGEAENNGNNVTTVTKFFGMNGYAYCGMTVKYGFKKAACNLIDGCSNPFYVPTLRQFMDSKGWRVSNSDAQPGDIFIYGNDQHTGFIYEKYSGLTVIALEGNATVYATLAAARASGTGTGAYEGIGYKKRYLNSSFKIYRPPYDGSTSGTITGANRYIKEFQTWINANYGGTLDVDGSFGKLTRAAATRALQTYLNKTYNAGLAVDGSCGPLTKAAIDGREVRKGSKGDLVYILQGLLYCRSYDPNGLDGDFGSGTDKAVRAYQSAKGLTVDGEAGAQTFGSLLSA